ncbi:MAG: peptide ABC transporter substrate-binding protein [Candidatus Eremiobacteraeota bacterium]|nr:peptide ABC transporter substrate-binding protein [Candidatus Eremiobacteraeota bacterium]
MKRLLTLAAAAAVLSACTQTGGGTAGAGRNPGTIPGHLRVAIQQDVKNLNPLLNSNTTDAMIARLMFEPLISADPKGNPVPILASVVPTTANGGISKDGLTITYHLRKDAKWTDGVPVTAKDVKFSYDAIMNPNNNVISRHGYDFVKSLDTPDDYTVIVHLKQKFAPFVNTFFGESDQPYPIAPGHVLSKYPNINTLPFNNNPNVSDGPFKFVRWIHGDRIELAANPDFFMGKPKLDGITLREITDENTTINLLRTHDIDWMYQASITNYPKVKDIPGITIHWVNVNGYEDVQLNAQRPLLQDVRVRQAIAYLFDRRRMISNLTYDQEQMALEDQPHFMWSFDDHLQPTQYDVSKAKQLLQQAGWTPGADGIVQKNGQKLTLVLVSNNSNATRRQNAVQIQSMLRQGGIDVEVKYYPGDILFAPVGEGGILQGGKFDLSLAGWFAGVDPDDSSQYTCANVAPKGYNYSRYCNPDMEAAQNDALNNYDQAGRKKAYDRIQELLQRDVPEVFFWDLRQMHPISTDFKGFDPNPVMEPWNAWQWSI